MTSLDDLTRAIESGNRADARQSTGSLLQAGYAPLQIVTAGLMPAMDRIGEQFRNGEIFVPEMLVAARAMNEALAILEPLLTGQAAQSRHTVVVGTVRGDLHDIGKNLVAMMLKGGNFRVVDLGASVDDQRFVDAVHDEHAALVGLSCLLTTTMPAMRDTVRALRGAAPSDLKIMVGGAPVTASFAEEIGADGYGEDAATAVQVANRLVAARAATEGQA